MQPKVVIARKDFAAPVTLGARGVCDRVVYTLDGSDPTASSTVYTGPVALPGEATTVLKARCVRGGKLVGQTASTEFQTNPPVPPKPDVYLDTLEPISFKTGWQAPGAKAWRNVDCHGQPLKVVGEPFARGVGMHANGEAVFAVKSQYERLVCRVGIDDAAGGRGSARVKVFLDDKLLCQTPVLTGKDGLWNINARLDGTRDKSVLRIVIENNGDGIDGDNVKLVDAGFIAQQGPAHINYYNAPLEAVEAWRQWKFGMHMQWGPSALGGEQPNPAGLIGTLVIKLRNGRQLEIPTDGEWQTARTVAGNWTSATGSAAGWDAAMELGSLAMAPRGVIGKPASYAELFCDFSVISGPLAKMGVAPDFESDGPLRYSHRLAGDSEIYFVANREDRPVDAKCRFRVSGKSPEIWDPLAGGMRFKSAAAASDVDHRVLLKEPAMIPEEMVALGMECWRIWAARRDAGCADGRDIDPPIAIGWSDRKIAEERIVGGRRQSCPEVYREGQFAHCACW